MKIRSTSEKSNAYIGSNERFLFPVVAEARSLRERVREQGKLVVVHLMGIFHVQQFLAQGIPAPGVSISGNPQQMECCPCKCLHPLARISSVTYLLCCRNHLISSVLAQDRMMVQDFLSLFFYFPGKKKITRELIQ